ncbi:MAG: J domain-containing protein [Arthrobacter sp.]
MNRDPRGYYAALHVTPDSTPSEIQRAFRALVRLHHPDVDPTAGAAPGAVLNDGDGDGVGRILEAFAVLRDPKARAEYDPAAKSARPGRIPTRGRDIPVRLHREEQPVIRATPVRWEQGPG